MKQQPDIALDFAFSFRSQASLVAINANGAITARRFDIGQRAEAKKWLKKHEKAGLYFHVNRVRDGVKGKAKKSDIDEVRHLHVDVDRRAGEDAEPELARMLARLEAHDPPPCAIVFSGNGYHAYWQLDAPVDPEVAEACNLALAQDLDGDVPCRDVSRIMRLPGTINWPNAQKRKKGRKPAMATVVRAFVK